MRVFVTGATGYLGGAISRCLRSRGYEVVGLARTGESARRLESIGLTAQIGTLEQPEILARASRDADGVIHAALSQSAQAGEIDAQAVAAMLEALSASGKPFVYTSGIWVMGNTNGRAATEIDPLNPTPVVAWRPAVEHEVLAATTRHIRTSVIRPAMVHGRCGGFVAGYLKSAREEGSALVVGDGENRWPFVHLNDLAELYVLMLEHAPAATLLLASAGEAVRVKDVAAAASRAAGAQGRVRFVPLEDARRSMGELADALTLDQLVDSSKARRLLGWNPTAPGVLEELETNPC